MKKEFFVILIGLLYTTCALGQDYTKNDWSLFLYGKNHKFYSAGQFELGESNEATGYGVGLSFHKNFSKRFGLFGGYGYSLADNLPYDNFSTTNAVFHQVEANLFMKIFRIKKLQPYVFSGYTYNYLQQIEEAGLENDGVSINLGAGAEYRFSKRFGLGYQLTYGFSITEQIPFNFRNQIGIFYHPKYSNPSKNKYSKPIDLEDKTGKFSSEKSAYLDRLESENDSLILVLKSLPEANKNTQAVTENKGLIAAYNEELSKHVAFLEEDNQRLLEELRSKRFLTDSLYTASFESYTAIDSTGAVQKNWVPITGYYLKSSFTSSFGDTKKNVLLLKKNELQPSQLLNKKDKFTSLTFVSTDLVEAEDKWSQLKEKKVSFKLVRVR